MLYGGRPKDDHGMSRFHPGFKTATIIDQTARIYWSSQVVAPARVCVFVDWPSPIQLKTSCFPDAIHKLERFEVEFALAVILVTMPANRKRYMLGTSC